MKEIILIVLVWVTADLTVAGWRLFTSSLSKYEVDRTNRQYQEAIEQEFARE